MVLLLAIAMDFYLVGVFERQLFLTYWHNGMNEFRDF